MCAAVSPQEQHSKPHIQELRQQQLWCLRQVRKCRRSYIAAAATAIAAGARAGCCSRFWESSCVRQSRLVGILSIFLGRLRPNSRLSRLCSASELREAAATVCSAVQQQKQLLGDGATSSSSGRRWYCSRRCCRCRSSSIARAEQQQRLDRHGQPRLLL